MVRKAGTGRPDGMTTRKITRSKTVGSKGKTKTVSRKAKCKRLNEEALRKVEERAGEIADALVKNTLLGDKKCAAMLMDLALDDGDKAKQSKPLRSLALRLAAEPQLPRESLTEPARGRE